MTNDNAIRSHRLQIASSIEKCFAFGNTGRGNTNVNRVRGKAFCRNFERGSRPGRRFKEKVDYRPPAQGRDFFDFASRDVAESLGRIEQVSNLTCRQVANSQEMSAIKRHFHGSLHSSFVLRLEHSFALELESFLVKTI